MFAYPVSSNGDASVAGSMYLSGPNKNSKRKNELWFIYVIDKRTLYFCFHCKSYAYRKTNI